MRESSVIRGLRSKCVICPRLRGRFGEKKMANLQSERTKEQPPFTYCCDHMFGPFKIKERRTTLNPYGALFTCLASRAIHVEMKKTLETDSFVMTLRGFIARRGIVNRFGVKMLKIALGPKTNLKRASEKWITTKLENSCWHKLLIGYSGRWTLLSQVIWAMCEGDKCYLLVLYFHQFWRHSTNLDNESLDAFFAEIKAIVNSRPLAVEAINNGNSEVTLSLTNLENEIKGNSATTKGILTTWYLLEKAIEKSAALKQQILELMT